VYDYIIYNLVVNAKIIIYIIILAFQHNRYVSLEN